MITSTANAGNEFDLANLAMIQARSAVQQASDAALVESIADGDKRAMQELFSRHNARLFRFVLRFTRDEATAEDVVSEVFIDVWRKADKFEGRSEVSTWLLAIARNKALETLRRRPTEELDDDTRESIEDPTDNQEVTIQKKEMSKIMLKCLSQLSRVHREIIDLVYYKEMSINDVSETIGIAPNTVKTRMFYARKRLAELLSLEGINTVQA
jgi:RNA polymerase sigma-70 factor (ECF subfamily)